MLIARLLHHMDAVGELVDIVGVLVAVPYRQTPEIFLQGIVGGTEITVDDAVQHLLGKMQPSLVHLRPERVLDVVVDAGEVRILAAEDHTASQLEEARHNVVLKLVVGIQPLLDGLHPRLAAVCLAGTVEVPGTQEVGMLVARFHHAGGIDIVGTKLLVGILHRLVLVDAISHADLAEVADILVVPARFKVVAPLLQELLDVRCSLFDGDGSHLLPALLLSLRLSVGSTFERFRLHRLLGIKLLQVAIIQRERHRLPVEESLKVVGKSGASGDISASLVALQSQQMLVVALRLLQHQVEEVEDGDVLVVRRRILAEYMETPAADAAMHHHGMLILHDELLDVLHLVAWHGVELHHQLEGRFQEISQLSAISVHLGRDGDGRAFRLQLVGEALADLQTLSIEQREVFDDRVFGDEFFHRFP